MNSTKHMLWIILPQDEWMSKTDAAGNTSDASNKNNCPCSNNQHVNCSSLQDGGGNKGLEMTLFTSADCFKKRRESSIAIGGLGRTKEGKEKRERERGEEDEEKEMEGERAQKRVEFWGEGWKRGWKLLQSGWKTPLRERARLLYWPGLKSILEAIVCNSDKKAAR